MLTGLTAGPSQVWGAVRLVPLLRDRPITDLRLHPRCYGEDSVSIVDLPDKTLYGALVPHALVAQWGEDASAAYGTQVKDDPECCGLVFRKRMAKREDRNRLRFLPQHMAFEGYLALAFAGPPIAWQEWTGDAVRRGLQFREEIVYHGGEMPGLADALRIFEIHPDQCGVAVYFADALAGVFVMPHPDDYRLLHPTLLRDFYGELLHQYATLYPSVPEFAVSLGSPTTFAGLRTAITAAKTGWADFHTDVMAAGLTEGRSTTVYRMGDRYTLSRFLPSFDPRWENHIGETITDKAGAVAYLSTFRLSAAQAKKGYLLAKLDEHDWNLDDAATAMGTTRDGLVTRLGRAGFGSLLRRTR